VLAGCGGSSARPTLAKADAAPLIALAGKIAGENACGQARDIPRLTRKTIALVNTGRVPAGLQEQLVSGVNDLAAQAPACVKTVPAPTPTSPAPAPPPKHPGKGKGHGKHGNGDGGGDEQ
jgi:hypothetical protein